MQVVRLLLCIAMFQFGTSKNIFETQLILPACPDYCRCDFMSVDCSNSSLSKIPPEINRNITFLDLSFNNFNGIPTWIINLPHLLHLELSYNPNIRLIEINFEKTSLKNLQLRSCSIDYIDNSVLRGFSNLEILNLSGNPIYFLNNSLVSLSLKLLDLSKCNLKHLRPESISRLASLSYLSLKDNYNLRQIHCGSDNLLTLDLSNCNIEHVPFTSFKKVVELNLHGNNIQWLRNKSFTNITDVENLNISYNALKQIEVNSFSHLIHLTVLDLSYNRLVDIDNNTFRNNGRLRSLQISHNYLKQIEGISSNSLELLDSSSCEINYLKKSSLTNIPALTELHLSRNRISQIPDYLEGPHLVYLDLGYNSITSINNQTFVSLRYLRFLILTGNKLTTVSPNFFPQVIDISMEDNSWLCDCDALHQMYSWMIRTDQETKYLTCQLPTELQGLTWEKACRTSWSKEHTPKRSMWLYSLSFFMVLVMLLFLVYVSKKIDQSRKTQAEHEAAERLATERNDYIQRQQTRDRLRQLEEQEESRNAPDPRESSGPPTYNEALMLPRLDASHPSLAGSLPSLSSLRNSNTDVSKRRRHRRKRRRRKSLPQPDGASSSNHTDASDTERQLNATELEESSF